MISNRFQVNHAALLHDAPGPHPDDQACQAKAQNPIWGGRLGPLGPGPPKLVLGFGSGFGTDFFEKKSYTKVSDKFLSLTSLKKKPFTKVSDNRR